jgi:hypothetical protein
VPLTGPGRGDPSAFVRRFRRIAIGVAVDVVGASATAGDVAEDVARRNSGQARRYASVYDARRGSVRAWLSAMSTRDDMTCAQVHDMSAELALGVLLGRQRAAALAHLERCKACREDVRQLMVTGGQLLELLPPAEPPAGFETRVLTGLGVPAPPEGRSEPRPLPTDMHRPRHRSPPRGGVRPGRDRPWSATGIGPTGIGPTGTGSRRPGRVRRALAATAMGLAVIAAGLGGWRIGVGPSLLSPAAARLSSASLLSATHVSVGHVFLSPGTPRWLFMHVDMGSGNDSVTCQVVGTDGRASTLGRFLLKDGHAVWGSPDPGNVGPLTAVRLIFANGTVLATATFPD